MERIIEQNQINKRLSELMEDFEIIAPVKDGNLVLFKPIKKVEEVLSDYTNPLKPAKEFFFPPRESLFSFKDKGLEPSPRWERNRIIWGIRPCDARSLSLLDKVFGGEYEDSFYLEKRKKTLLVGLACRNPQSSCFCTSLNGGPHSTEGMDLLLTYLGEGTYFAQTVTSKGEELLNYAGVGVKKEDREKKERLEDSAKKMITKALEMPGDLEAIFDDPYWERISRKCISCAICSYLCPTCHCFDLTDEGRQRIRFWDSCSFPLFTKMTSGENPRREKRRRFRQRVYHKFDYFRKNFGQIACVGCGRCVRQCPVKMDIVEVINNIPRVEVKV
ncbi:MAG: 4Fe-4S dicluster domain-containing protein [bacterium]